MSETLTAMGWRRGAIVVCATVAVLAGAVTLVAGAVAADDASSGPGSTTRDGPGTRAGASAPYQSSVTITLDRPAAACAPQPAEGRPRTPAPCGAAERLPLGATEDDVLRTLGEPRTRRALGGDGEAWDYSRYADEQRYAFILTVLEFRDRRLVGSQQYDFK